MMLCQCDNCGKTEPAQFNGRYWYKPDGWYSRIPADEHVELTCCSRDCIDALEKKTGKSAPVAPW